MNQKIKNRNEVIYFGSKEKIINMEEYSYPKTAGCFTGILRCRCWHRFKSMLLCYFDTDDGHKYILSAWWEKKGVCFSPKETMINFADCVSTGTRWKCSYCLNKKGFISWRTAVRLK